MKTQKIKQFAIIESSSADDFEERLNETMEKLADCDPEVEFSSRSDTFARITYTKKKEIELLPPAEAGIIFTCGECPFFTPITKRDGTPDQRIKYGDCPCRELGRVWKTQRACDLLYTMIKNGTIHLALNSEEESEEVIIPLDTLKDFVRGGVTK